MALTILFNTGLNFSEGKLISSLPFLSCSEASCFYIQGYIIYNKVSSQKKNNMVLKKQNLTINIMSSSRIWPHSQQGFKIFIFAIFIFIMRLYTDENEWYSIIVLLYCINRASIFGVVKQLPDFLLIHFNKTFSHFVFFTTNSTWSDNLLVEEPINQIAQ